MKKGKGLEEGERAGEIKSAKGMRCKEVREGGWESLEEEIKAQFKNKYLTFALVINFPRMYLLSRCNHKNQ